MWNKRREQKTHVLEVLREVSATLVQKKNFHYQNSKNKNKFGGKNKAFQSTNFKKKTGKKKKCVASVVIQIIGLPIALTALTSDTRTTRVRWEPQKEGVMRIAASFPSVSKPRFIEPVGAKKHVEG
jgi:hypothetical protein